MTQGDASRSIDLSSIFTDADGDVLSYSATGSSNVQLSGKNLVLSSSSIGSNLISVTASDGRGGSVSTNFTLTVVAPNTPPQVKASIGNQTLTQGDASRSIDLSAIFTDADGDTLSYSATGSSNVLLSGKNLVISSTTLGNATISVTAKDGRGGTVSTNFNLTVNAPAPFSVTLQAEDQAWLNATVDSNHAGYTGRGFVNTQNVVNTWVEFTVTVPTSGNYNFSLRYANLGSERTQKILLNGTSVLASVPFANTGAWTSWGEQGFSLQLTAGTHKLRLVSLTSLGAANLDWLIVNKP